MSNQLTFEPEAKREGQLIFTMTIPGRLPSWNEILAMEHWQRYKFKNQLADNFSYELRAFADAFLTTTTCAKNMYAIYFATLVSYRETARQRRILRSASKKQTKGQRKKSGSKFSSSEKPPF